MAMSKTTKEERAELREIEAKATIAPWLPSESTRVPKVLDRDGGLLCEFDTVNGKNDRHAVAALRNIFPALLDDLDAAEAERDFVAKALHESVDACGLDYTASLPKAIANIRAQRDRAESELDAERKMRTEAEAAATMAEAERDDLRKIAEDCCNATDGGCSPGVTVEFLRGVSIDVAHIRKQRDAARAKLAALVEAAEPFACDQGCDAVHHPVADRHDQRDNCPVVARLRAAIAAARGGAK
jgi:hypothetical protein